MLAFLELSAQEIVLEIAFEFIRKNEALWVLCAHLILD